MRALLNSVPKHCVKRVQMRSYFWSVFSCIRTEYGDLLRLAASDVSMFIHMFSLNSIILQMPEKRDSSNSKNAWLLLSVTYTAKLELVFILTFENAFC